LLANHPLTDIPRLKGVIEAEAADVRVRADALYASQILHLRTHFNISRRHSCISERLKLKIYKTSRGVLGEGKLPVGIGGCVLLVAEKVR
jgi:hypothetical protein